jgi:hypothetical protein
LNPSAGADNQIKVWDVRTFKPLHSYFSYSPATSLDISQKGLMAVGYGSKVQVRVVRTCLCRGCVVRNADILVVGYGSIVQVRVVRTCLFRKCVVRNADILVVGYGSKVQAHVVRMCLLQCLGLARTAYLHTHFPAKLPCIHSTYVCQANSADE